METTMIARISLSWLMTYIRYVSTGNDVECSTTGAIELRGVHFPDLIVKVPLDCHNYTRVVIENSTIGNAATHVFTETRKDCKTLFFQYNQGINKGETQFNVDFSKTGITYYRISSNKMELGEGLRFQENAKRINLNYNTIRKLPSGMLKDLHKLQVLYLNNNSLSNLDADTFHGLHELRNLDLGGNKLDHFEPGIFKDLKKLLILTLVGNQFKWIPTDVISFWDGPAGRHLAVKPDTDVRGNPLTHLARCLTDQYFFYYDETPSLNITGKADKPGTATENICMNPRTPEEATTIDWLYPTSGNVDEPKSTISTTASPDQTKEFKSTISTTASPAQPKEFNWMCVLFPVIFFYFQF